MNHSPMAVRLVTHPDGSIEPQHKWLCTSPIHYRNILVSVTLGCMSATPSWRFISETTKLSDVGKALSSRGF